MAVVHGDGIGPQIVPQGVKALTAVGKRFGHDFNFVRVLMGYNAWKNTGATLPAETIEICRGSDGILLGATGAAHWEYTQGKVLPIWVPMPAGELPRTRWRFAKAKSCGS